MVVMPHGGPHGVRDYWRFDPYVQMLASRGFAVLQVNFRGSGGYGREFLYSGYKRWGLEMQDDVTDATLWAIANGITTPNSVCIFGASYGGYASLMGAVKEPDLYACAIVYVGVYDLEMMLTEGDIPETESGKNYLDQALGNDLQDLRQRSPINHLEKLTAPLMIVHGAKDRRVPIEQAEALRERMDDLGKEYEWLVKPNEGHGFYDKDNRIELYEAMLEFLNRHTLLQR
jgi:dipeptidyl aminopeptidase/acylaminoacyl peptidase